jgi:PAS domain S-box-containing protein/diguanylate cyclase (GGDEF)-like protein
MRTRAGRTNEEVLLLAVSAAAGVAAFVSLRRATPATPGLWVAAAVALALALAALFAFWFGGAARRRMVESLYGEWDAARSILSALPDGLLLVRDGRICSVNRELCRLLGFERQKLLGASEPFPFWAPEHHHEIVDWHAELEQRGESVRELTFSHRRGDRIRVLAAGRVIDDGHGARRQLVTVRDVSAGYRRERRLAELAARDPETGLLNRCEFEERLGETVRRAVGGGTNVTVVVAELAVYGRTGNGVFGRPEALLAVEQLRRRVRAGDHLARTGDAELAWILPETETAGGLEAIERWRADLRDVAGVQLSAGVCDLRRSGDAFALFALADRALSTARRRGPGSTEAHAPTVGPTASDDRLHS